MSLSEKNKESEDKIQTNPLMSILANALQSSQKQGPIQAGTETITCSCCGAARPADTNLQFCDYCGNQFF